MFFDSHTHCQFRAYGDDVGAMMQRTKEKNTLVNIVGTEKQSSLAAVEMARKNDFAVASIGLHPGHLFSEHHDEDESETKISERDFDFDFYDELAADKKVVAIGECGLDLYRLPENINRAEALKKQTEVFLLEKKLADKHSLPLVIHCRDAHEELISILSGFAPTEGVVHCFTADRDIAKKYLNLGLSLGFTGIITFPPKKKDPKPQEELWEVVKMAPIEKILVETDCPYLAPEAYRGKRGEPWMVEEVIKKIAVLKGLGFEDVAEITTANAQRLFERS